MTDQTQNPGAYLLDGHLFFRMPDRSTILCKCIGEPFSRMIVGMWNEQLQNVAIRAHMDAVKSNRDTGKEPS